MTAPKTLALAVSLSIAFILAACSEAQSDTAASASIAPTVTVAPAATATPAPSATPAPTATPPATPTAVPPTPTPTATPTPLPRVANEEIERTYGLRLGATVDGSCASTIDRRDQYPPRFDLECEPDQTVLVPASGIVAHIGRTSPTQTPPPAMPGAPAVDPGWAWTDIAAMGDYVVVDHGPLAGHGNVTSVHWGLNLASDLQLGSRLSSLDALGTVTDQAPSVQLWLTDAVVTAASPRGDIESPELPSAQEAIAIAEALAPTMAAPVEPTCTVDLGVPSDLPNSGRPYRSGTHRGVDLICGFADRQAFAPFDGTVVAVVNDYVDSAVQPRLDMLNNAALAGGTPHWTLTMLFGNFVVMEHVDPAGREVLTISAHLERVDPSVEVGAQLEAGAPLGEVGNRGTGPSAAGTTNEWDRSRHLHWEIFVDGSYLGAGLAAADTSVVYRTLFCGSAELTGC